MVRNFKKYQDRQGLTFHTHTGYHIHDGLSGSMHDHVLTFKVNSKLASLFNALTLPLLQADFDIMGTANTLYVGNGTIASFC